jgi:hypothetical protein
MEITIPLEFWFNRDPRLVMPPISFGKFYIYALVERKFEDVVNLLAHHKIYAKADEEVKFIQREENTVMFHTETGIYYATLNENNVISVLNLDNLP